MPPLVGLAEKKGHFPYSIFSFFPNGKHYSLSVNSVARDRLEMR